MSDLDLIKEFVAFVHEQIAEPLRLSIKHPHYDPYHHQKLHNGEFQRPLRRYQDLRLQLLEVLEKSNVPPTQK